MKYRYLHLLITSILLLHLSSCVVTNPSDFGRLQPNFQVNSQFHALQILPDHRYYYSGEILIPDAIIAIHNDYILDKGFWTEITLTKKQLQDWMWIFSTVEDTYDEDDRMTINYEGSIIVSPDNTPVGVYYSKYHETTVIFPGSNRIKIYKPDPPFNTRMIRMR